jgi:nucleoside triphosphate pyrophosphatase
MRLRLPLILASNSPRRRDLLAAAGVAAAVVPAEGVDEIHDRALKPADLTLANARAKAQCVAARHPGALVLGADTLVYLDGEPLGKPATADDAAMMIRRLSGRTHQVCTGVCLCARGGADCVEFHVISEVTFKRLDAAAIVEYLGLINPFDKAGAYAAQEHADFIIDHVNGSWTNVVGLPIDETLSHLRRWAASDDVTIQ